MIKKILTNAFSEEGLLKKIHSLQYFYILSLCFHSVFLNFSGFSVAPPEIILLFITPLTIFWGYRYCKEFIFSKGDIAVLLWLLTLLLTSVISGFNFIVLSELLKTFYLVLLYFLMRLTFLSKNISKIVSVFIFSSIIGSISAILGFFLAILGVNTSLTITREFPYFFSYVIQSQGFTSSPNMLASIIMVGFIFHINEMLRHNKPSFISWLVLITLLTGFIFTLSKTFLCLALGVILTLLLHYKSIIIYRLHRTLLIVHISFALFYLLTTHFVYLSNDDLAQNLKGDYIAGPPMLETSQISVYPSQYWSLNKIAITAIAKTFPWGVGPGNFNNYAHQTTSNYFYPTHVPYPDPHSTYLGTFAENGLLGLISLFFIIYLIGSYSSTILNSRFFNGSPISYLPIIFLILSIEALTTDIMHFRHYWILLSLIFSSLKYDKSFL